MNREKGVTLIELLATLTILMIISSLIFSVFIGINKNNQNISTKNNKDQQANIIISTIKSYHLNNDVYQIKYTDGKYYIGAPTATTNQLGNEDLIFLSIDNAAVTNLINIDTKNTNKAINVTIQLKNQKGIETIIMRY